MSWSTEKREPCNIAAAKCFCLGAALQYCYIRDFDTKLALTLAYICENFGFQYDPKLNDLGNVIRWNDYEATWEQVQEVTRELDL